MRPLKQKAIMKMPINMATVISGVRTSQQFFYYKSMGAITVTLETIVKSNLPEHIIKCSLFPTQMIVKLKFDLNWPTGKFKSVGGHYRHHRQ